MKKVAILLLLVALAFATIGCAKKDRIGGSPDDPIVNVADSDAEMNAAIEKARSSIDEFIGYYENPKPDMELFEIKNPFPEPDGGNEHIWIEVTAYSNGVFTGKIDNVPDYVPGLQLGQIVQVERSEISDWVVMKRDGTTIGGFTVAVLEGRIGSSEPTGPGPIPPPPPPPGGLGRTN